MDRETLAASVAKTAVRLRLRLSDMTAASQMLERTAGGERVGAYLAVLNQSICRMLRAVGQMELLSRLTDEDEIRVFPGEVDLGPWTGELAERARGILRGAGVALEYQGPKILLANVDQGLTRQMLLEMLCAAALPGEQVTLILTQREDCACFSVRGTGEPIPEEELAGMFDPWDREEPKGWGIPLAQRIAELHGGGLVAGAGGGGRISMVATLPLRLGLPSGRLEGPAHRYDAGGFDDALVAFSDLLPPQAFRPEEMG